MNKVQNLRRIIILILAVAAIIFGIMQQEHMVVMKKAVNICMECIGVG
nr:CD1871A family CXXC motif-containing protein [uncultured Dorea sp.]